MKDTNISPLRAAPKNVWSKPTIKIIEDIVDTRSGPFFSIVTENATYYPTTS